MIYFRIENGQKAIKVPPAAPPLPTKACATIVAGGGGLKLFKTCPFSRFSEKDSKRFGRFSARFFLSQIMKQKRYIAGSRAAYLA